MTDRNQQVDDIFRCLLSNIEACQDTPQRRYQEFQLLSAFNSIQDSKLRQELVTLIEIVALMPETMRHFRESSIDRGPLTVVH